MRSNTNIKTHRGRVNATLRVKVVKTFDISERKFKLAILLFRV